MRYLYFDGNGSQNVGVSCERSTESEIVEAWREAAGDLGLLITTPYVLAIAGEAPVRFIALIVTSEVKPER